MKWYTVYNRKTDMPVALGTAAECERQLHMSRDTFYSTVSHSRAGREKKYEVLVEDVEEDEDGSG